MDDQMNRPTRERAENGEYLHAAFFYKTMQEFVKGVTSQLARGLAARECRSGHGASGIHRHCAG